MNRDIKEFQKRFERWKAGENYWKDIRGIDLFDDGKDDDDKEFHYVPEMVHSMEYPENIHVNELTGDVYINGDPTPRTLVLGEVPVTARGSLYNLKRDINTAPNDNIWVDVPGKEKNPQIAQARPVHQPTAANEIATSIPGALISAPLVASIAGATGAGATLSSGLRFLLPASWLNAMKYLNPSEMLGSLGTTTGRFGLDNLYTTALGSTGKNMIGALADAGALSWWTSEFANAALNSGFSLEGGANAALAAAGLIPVVGSAYNETRSAYNKVKNLLYDSAPSKVKSVLRHASHLLFPGRHLKKYSDAEENARRALRLEYELAGEKDLPQAVEQLILNNPENFTLEYGSVLPKEIGINTGEYVFPDFKSGETVAGNIGPVVKSHLSTQRLNTEGMRVNPKIDQYTTRIGTLEDMDKIGYLTLKEPYKYTQDAVENSFEYIPFGQQQNMDMQKLRQTIRNNMEYLQQKIPGVKFYGSSVATENGTLKANVPGDIETMMTKAQYEKFKSLNPKLNISEIDKNGKASYIADPSAGHAGEVDINVVDVDAYGNGNRRAYSIYLQYFPEEYHNTVRRAASGKLPLVDSLNYRYEFPILDMNGNPITAEQLLSRYDGELSTILDSFLINFSAGGKGKHKNRLFHYLSGDRPDLVSRAISLFSKMLTGGLEVHFPKLTFGSVEDNINLLREIKFRGDVAEVAKSEEKMQNVMDAWYLGEGGMFSRASGPGDRHEGDIVTDTSKLIRNFSKWLFTGEGGTVSGFGLNYTAGGNSGASRGLVGYVFPYIKGLKPGMLARNAIQLVRRALLHPDYKLTLHEADVFNLVYKKYGINVKGEVKAGDNGHSIHDITRPAYANPGSSDYLGELLYNANKEIAERLNLNFAIGETYGYHGSSPYFAGSMRDMRYNGEHADILGVVRHPNDVGGFDDIQSWNARVLDFDLKNKYPEYTLWHEVDTELNRLVDAERQGIPPKFTLDENGKLIASTDDFEPLHKIREINKKLMQAKSNEKRASGNEIRVGKLLDSAIRREKKIKRRIKNTAHLSIPIGATAGLFTAAFRYSESRIKLHNIVDYYSTRNPIIEVLYNEDGDAVYKILQKEDFSRNKRLQRALRIIGYKRYDPNKHKNYKI